MSRRSIVILSSVPPIVSYVGDPVRVDTWYTNVQNLNTISIVSSNFKGRLIVEASVKAHPTDNDWFPVLLNGNPYIDYPRNGLSTSPISTPSLSFSGGGLGAETSTIAFNFSGRFTWMRARVDRSFIIPADANEIMIAACGFIDRILLNL